MNFILIILFILLPESKDQNDPSKLLVGDWKGISKVMIEKGDTVDYTLDQKGYQNNEYLQFKADGTVIVSSDTRSTYEIEGKTLTMGNRVYLIEEIDKKKLILSIEALGADTRFWLAFERVK